MPEDSHSFSSTRTRLEEIVSQVRKKDTSLEKSLDLLEEGVRLANQCTELIDHADWEAAGAPAGEGVAGDGEAVDDAASDGEGASAAQAAVTSDDSDENGDGSADMGEESGEDEA